MTYLCSQCCIIKIFYYDWFLWCNDLIIFILINGFNKSGFYKFFYIFSLEITKQKWY